MWYWYRTKNKLTFSQKITFRGKSSCFLRYSMNQRGYNECCIDKKLDQMHGFCSLSLKLGNMYKSESVGK